jgi:outer membrane receptor protein involved in Fe transport
MLIRPGVPVIDRLNGGTGTSRHLLMLQLGAGKRGIGATLNANWSSAARVDTGSAGDALRIVPGTTLSFSAFVDPDQLFPHSRERFGGKNLHLSLSVGNLLNNYSRVTLKSGAVPAGFSHDEIDPLGRTVRLTVRKRF